VTVSTDYTLQFLEEQANSSQLDRALTLWILEVGESPTRDGGDTDASQLPACVVCVSQTSVSLGNVYTLHGFRGRRRGGARGVGPGGGGGTPRERYPTDTLRW